MPRVWTTWLTQGVVQLVCPCQCPLCGRPHDGGGGVFCNICHAGITVSAGLTCPCCAQQVGPHSHLEDGCPACRCQSFAFDSAIALGPHEDLRREAVLRLKSPGGEDFAELVALAAAPVLVERLAAVIPQLDLVIPVPLHWRRRWRRGFNQSEILARELARRLDLPCRSDWLRRLRDTPQQKSEQSLAQRRANVRDAFAVSPRARLARQAVLLVDDVLTTGSTCHEAAQALRRGGAARVHVALLARAG